MKLHKEWRIGLILLLAIVLGVVDFINLRRDGLDLGHWIPFGYTAVFVAFAFITHRVQRG